VKWTQFLDPDGLSLMICGSPTGDAIGDDQPLIVAEWTGEEWLDHKAVVPEANLPVGMTHIAMWADIPDPDQEILMDKYERVVKALAASQTCKMKVFGRSMLPIIESGSKLTFQATNDYQVGDVVFCKVKGRYIDAHKITKIDSQGRFMIANNRGRENGWASQIYGRVVEVNGEPFGRCIIPEDDTAKP
jgi:hypothetical protein